MKKFLLSLLIFCVYHANQVILRGKENSEIGSFVNIIDAISFINEYPSPCEMSFEASDATVFIIKKRIAPMSNFSLNNSGGIIREFRFFEEDDAEIAVLGKIALTIVNLDLKFTAKSNSSTKPALSHYVNVQPESTFRLLTCAISGKFSLKPFLMSLNSSIEIFNTSFSNTSFCSSRNGTIMLFEALGDSVFFFTGNIVEDSNRNGFIFFSNSLVSKSQLKFIKCEGKLDYLSINSSQLSFNFFQEEVALGIAFITLLEFNNLDLMSNSFHFGWCSVYTSKVINISNVVFHNNSYVQVFPLLNSGFFLDTSAQIDYLYIKNAFFLQNFLGVLALYSLRGLLANDFFSISVLDNIFIHNNTVSLIDSETSLLIIISIPGQLDFSSCFVTANRIIAPGKGLLKYDFSASGQIIFINDPDLKLSLKHLFISENTVENAKNLIVLKGKLVKIELLVILTGYYPDHIEDASFFKYERNMITFDSETIFLLNIIILENKFEKTVFYSNTLKFEGSFINEAPPVLWIGNLFMLYNKFLFTSMLFEYSESEMNFEVGNSMFIHQTIGSLFNFLFNTGSLPLYFFSCIFLNNGGVGVFLLETGSQAIFLRNSILINIAYIVLSYGSSSSNFQALDNIILINTPRRTEPLVSLIHGVYLEKKSTYFIKLDKKNPLSALFSISEKAFFIETSCINMSGNVVFIDARSGSEVSIENLVLSSIAAQSCFLRGRGQAKFFLAGVKITHSIILENPFFLLNKLRAFELINATIESSSFEGAPFIKAMYSDDIIKLTNLSFLNSKGPLFVFMFSKYVEINTFSVENCVLQVNVYLIDLASHSNVSFKEANISKLNAPNGAFKVSESTLRVTGLEFSANFEAIRNYPILFSIYYSSVSIENGMFRDRLYNLAAVSNSNLSLINFNITDEPALADFPESFIKITNSYSIFLSNCTFKNLKGLSGGVIYMSNSKTQPFLNLSSIEISNCIFINNSATTGGALFLENIFSNISHTLFQENTASVSGGALRLICDFNDGGCKTSLLNNEFFNNKANHSGGALMWSTQEPVDWEKNTYSGNKAFYGNDIASFPIRAKLQKTNAKTKELEPYSQEERPLFTNVSSGTALKEKILIKLYDNEDRWVLKWSDANPPIISLFDEVKEHRWFLPSGIKDSALIGALRPTISAGIIDFSGIIVRGDPGRVVTLKVNFGFSYFPAFAGLLSNNEYVSSSGIYHLLIDIHLRKCVLGEILVKGTQVCKLCDENSYSLIENSDRCSRCPYNFNCSGTRILSLVNGFWVLPGTDKILSCRMDKNQCLPGNICAEGYSGLMCEKCQLGFYKIPGIACTSCSMNWLQVILLIISHTQYLLAIVISLHYISNVSIESREKSIARLIISYIHSASLFKYFAFPNIDDRASENFLNKMQEFPRILSIPSLGIDFTYSNSVVECLIENDNDESRFFLKLLILNLIPFVYVFGLLIFWLIKTPFSITSNKYLYFKRNMIASVVAIYFTFEPSVLKNCLYALSCLSVDNTYYLNFGLEVECYTWNHFFWAATTVFPLVLLVIFFLPLIFILRMRRIKSKKRVISSNALFCYRFLLNGYKKEKYFWEFVIMGRKLILEYLVLLTYHWDMKKCLFYTLTTLFLFLLLQIKYKPYIWNDLNTMELFSLLSISSITFLYFFAHTKSNGMDNNVLVVLCLLFNLFFIYKVLKYIIHLTRFYYRKFSSNAKKLSQAFIFRVERSFMRPKLSRSSKISKRSCLPRFRRKTKISFDLLIPHMSASIAASHIFIDSDSQENIIYGSRSFKHFKFNVHKEDKKPVGRRNRYTELLLLSPQRVHKQKRKEHEEDIDDITLRECNASSRKEIPVMDKHPGRSHYSAIVTEDQILSSNRSGRDVLFLVERPGK